MSYPPGDPVEYPGITVQLLFFKILIFFNLNFFCDLSHYTKKPEVNNTKHLQNISILNSDRISMPQKNKAQPTLYTVEPKEAGEIEEGPSHKTEKQPTAEPTPDHEPRSPTHPGPYVEAGGGDRLSPKLLVVKDRLIYIPVTQNANRT